MLGIALGPLHEFSLVLVNPNKMESPFIFEETEAQEGKSFS